MYYGSYCIKGVEYSLILHVSNVDIASWKGLYVLTTRLHCQIFEIVIR